MIFKKKSQQKNKTTEHYRNIKKNNQTTFRSIKIDDNELEFSGGFTNLHNLVYKDIINGKGYGLAEARTAIEIVENIRTSQKITGNKDYCHPLAL